MKKILKPLLCVFFVTQSLQAIRFELKCYCCLAVSNSYVKQVMITSYESGYQDGECKTIWKVPEEDFKNGFSDGLKDKLGQDRKHFAPPPHCSMDEEQETVEIQLPKGHQIKCCTLISVAGFNKALDDNFKKGRADWFKNVNRSYLHGYNKALKLQSKKQN